MNKRSEIGIIGEDMACKYLVRKGYKILHRNLKVFRDEIDIVAINIDGTLVFVEVKTMENKNILDHGLKPEDNLTGSKFYKLTRSAQMFAGKHPELVKEDRGWRIDLIAISLPDKKISHYENI